MLIKKFWSSKNDIRLYCKLYLEAKRVECMFYVIGTTYLILDTYISVEYID